MIWYSILFKEIPYGNSFLASLFRISLPERFNVFTTCVNSWVKRFEAEGIKGLETRPGRGRKPIMDSSDEEAVRIAIENDRQSVKKAKEAWQQASGKEASESTFRSFLSALARDIDV